MTYIPPPICDHFFRKKTAWENGPVFRGLVYTGKLWSYEKKEGKIRSIN